MVIYSLVTECLGVRSGVLYADGVLQRKGLIAMEKVEKGFIKLICPQCKQFLAYIKVESDLYCPRCKLWVYRGGDNQQKT